MDETILVARRREVFADEASAFHGYLPLDAPAAPEVLRGLAAAPFGARRGDVEEDPSLLQPIPYVVLSRRSAGGRPEVFAYERLGGGGERRLHGRVSVGVGGHMNRGFDADSLLAVVQEEARRELEEELRFADAMGRELPAPPARLAGLINDDTGPVQQVHIGLLLLAEVPADVEVTVRETEQLAGEWRSIEQLRAPELAARLEEWSRHALEALPVG